MIILNTFLIVCALVLLVPGSLLLLQVASAWQPHRARPLPGGRRPIVAIIVPAHDEATLIARTLRSIVPQLAAGDRLLVVADNCKDDTASIAAAAGAEVIARTDVDRRGKGYALDFGIRHLAQMAPDVVLVIDGDCEIAAGAVEHLARRSAASGRPVQALYRMHAPARSSITTRIAGFAWLVKNQVRPLGFHRLGLPCQLMGTGMAFPWHSISQSLLATGHLVEDLKLGVELARAGMPPLLCPEARVNSSFPATGRGLAEQRRRWEHGHLGMILGVAPGLFVQGLAQRRLPLLAMALDLCVPPLALLMLLATATCAGSVAAHAYTGTTLPLLLATAALVLPTTAVLLAWMRHGRSVIALQDLACAPLYMLWKVPLYLMFALKRQAAWVRTRRDAE